MKKRNKMVIAIAIAVALACTHHTIKKEKTNQQQLPAKETSVPYVPTAFSDMSLFPGNVFQFLINHL